MTQKILVYVYLFAFILGLLLTGVFAFSQGFILGLSLFFVLFIIWFFFRNQYPLIVNLRYFFLLFLVVIAGFYYYYFRFPSLTDLDISRYISSSFSEKVRIEGVILTTPRVNQNHKAKFIVEARQLVGENSYRKEVRGKVYVTSPLLAVNGLFPSTVVSLQGNLYKPSPPLNPDGFDFADYLRRQGVFSGLSAYSLEVIGEGNWWQGLLFNLRQRILRTHVRFLNIPFGSLVSSMVMGSRGVDLSFQLQEAFRLGGLAHILAASGFHVSLLLGVVLGLTQSFSLGYRLWLGLVVLFVYATITGFYPSILRSCLMGVGVLIGIVNERKVRVFASLLLAAVILLLINPLWIWDIGFQLSFLATFGLIVSLPAMVERLDWLPPTLANVLAVSLSATVWVLPLLFYHFHRFPLYSVITNVLATPLVIVITLGGFFTAFVGVFSPLLGGAIAFLLFPFIWLLIKLVEISNQLPFSSLAVGEINIIILSLIYLILLLITYTNFGRKYRYILILFALSIVILPLIYQKVNLVQVTVIDSRVKPVVIIQNKGHVALINLGDKSNVYFNLLPFLKSQGVNKVELVLSNEKNNDRSLAVLNKYLFVENINDYQLNKIEAMKIIETNKNYVFFQLKNKNFLVINDKIEELSIDNFIDFVIVTQKSFDYNLLADLKVNFLLVKNPDSLPQLDKVKVLPMKNNFLQWRFN